MICLYVCHPYEHIQLQERDYILFIFVPSVASTLELLNSNLTNDWEARSQEGGKEARSQDLPESFR